MNKRPTISIITIVYNGLPYLKECINSVLEQEFDHWELLISDDGSTDGSREYLSTLKDSRIKISLQEKNLGIFGNLNFLFEKATAPVSQILCQDDYFTDRFSLQKIVTYWEKAPAEVGFTRFNHQFERTKNLVSFEKVITPSVIKAGEADVWFYVFGNIPGNLSNVSLRTHIVNECGWFNQQYPYAGDFEFWSRAARKVGMGVEKDLVIYVRKHDGQASNYLNFKGELISQKIAVVNNIFQHAIAKHPQLSFALKLHGTLNYDSLERDRALKFFLKGNSNYLKELNKRALGANYSFGPFARWVLFIVSAGGRMWRVATAKKIIKTS